MARPNLFEFATSELSQDAFICWLISWASPEQASGDDAPLHKTAVALLNKMFELNGLAPPAEYRSVDVKKQDEKVDVLVFVNQDIAIIIEDKTCTSEHSGQLTRYLQAVRDKFKDRKTVIGIYFKTGDQSSYRNVEDAKFVPLCRRQLLEVLARGKSLGVRNAIFDDFYERLKTIEYNVHAYERVPPSDWTRNDIKWTGFYIELQRRLGEGSWGYVANPSGGFMGFWWHWKNGLFQKYLQLEEENLCFKIQVEDKARRAEYWKKWHEALVAASPQVGLTLKRPRRRLGKWMTVATLDDDYRQTRGECQLDLDRTVAMLRQAEQLLNLAAAK